jgi:acyl-homoserine lactone acylase PvdQ
VAYISSDLSNSTGKLLSAAERASARGKALCEGVEQYSQGLNDYASDLLNQRKNEYRDLKLDFN